MKKIYCNLTGLILSCLFFFPFQTYSQECCTEAPITVENTSQLANTGTPARLGQSFTACQTGEVVSITMRFNDLNQGAPEGKLILFEGEGPSSFSEISFDVVIPGGEVIHTFVLEEPFDVTEGQLYTWMLEGPLTMIHIKANGSGIYDGGEAFQNEDPTQVSDLDLIFSLDICESTQDDDTDGSGDDTADDEQPEDQDGVIPTLGEWGLILLSLCLLIIGVVAIKDPVYKASVK